MHIPSVMISNLESCLREFVVNSRHPGPRRVWKVGSEQQLLPPLPGNPRDPVDPVENSERLDFVARRGT